MAVKVNIVNMPNTVKQSGRRVRTQLGVLHSAECPLRRGFPMSLTQWTIDTAVKASWHEFVGPGVVVQAVHSDYIAWHASVANWISWGTEQTGYAAYSRDQWLSKDGRDQLERVAMQWASDAIYFGWELGDLRWLDTPTVLAIVAGDDTTTKGFCTHSQVDPASRTDPGPNYPYELLMQRVRHHFTQAGGLQAVGEIIEIQNELEQIMSARNDFKSWLNWDLPRVEIEEDIEDKEPKTRSLGSFIRWGIDKHNWTHGQNRETHERLDRIESGLAEVNGKLDALSERLK